LSVANLGDLDGDGIQDIVVGANGDDAGSSASGAVHISFLNTDGSVKSTVEINSNTANGPTLLFFDQYGTSVANLGDLDGDDIQDIVVGADTDDAGGGARGTVHISFLNTDGSVKSTVEINSTTTNGPVLADSDTYGTSVANLGDLDGDGVQDIVVGSDGDDAGGSARGAVHIIFLLQVPPLGVEISACGNLSGANNTYLLTSDVSASANCFNISVSDVTLDCQGNTITYGTESSGIGVNVSKTLSNVSVKNCVITKGSTLGGNNYGVQFEGVVNGTILNNTIATNGGSTDNYGIYLTSSTFNNISNNSISTNGTSTNVGLNIDSSSSNNTIQSNTISTNGTSNNNYGVFISSSSSNTVSSNTISTDGSGNANYGVFISSSSSSTNVTSNTISTDGSGNANYGVRISTGSFNTIQSNTISTNGTNINYGVLIGSSSSNTIQNNSISTAGSSGDNYGVRIASISSNNILQSNIINTTGSNSAGFSLDGSAGNFPENNNITNNTLGIIAGSDINFVDAGINGTFLIDQKIRSYAFTGFGSLVNFKNSSAGVIEFLTPINESGGNLSLEVIIRNNTVIVNSTHISLNKSANITLFNIGSFQNPSVRRDGSACDLNTEPSCVNFTSLNADTEVAFKVSSWTTYSISENVTGVETTGCGNLDTASTTYTLVQDVSASANCFNISASDVILDCQGKTITFGTGTTGFGVNASSDATTLTNITVKNCNIVKGAGGGSNNYGIRLDQTSNSVIYNNTIFTNGTSSNSGIRLETASGSNNISLNNLTTIGSGASNVGIAVSANGNLIFGNEVHTNGTSSNFGITVTGNQGTVSSNKIFTAGSQGLNYGVQLAGDGNTIYSNTIATNGSIDNYGFYLNQGDNNK